MFANYVCKKHKNKLPLKQLKMQTKVISLECVCEFFFRVNSLKIFWFYFSNQWSWACAFPKRFLKKPARKCNSQTNALCVGLMRLVRNENFSDSVSHIGEASKLCLRDKSNRNCFSRFTIDFISLLIEGGCW
jgi:hypothetical protein